MSNLKSTLGGVLTWHIQSPTLDPGTASKKELPLLESQGLVLVLLK